MIDLSKAAVKANAGIGKAGIPAASFVVVDEAVKHGVQHAALLY